MPNIKPICNFTFIVPTGVSKTIQIESFFNTVLVLYNNCRKSVANGSISIYLPQYLVTGLFVANDFSISGTTVTMASCEQKSIGAVAQIASFVTTDPYEIVFAYLMVRIQIFDDQNVEFIQYSKVLLYLQHNVLIINTIKNF